MHISLLFSSALAAALLQGCNSARRERADEVAGLIAAGRAVSPEDRQVVRVQSEARRDDRIREAYELGQLQAAKSLHQAIQNTQRTDVAEPGRDRTLIPLTIPERKIDGVIINQGVEYVRLPR